MSTEQSMNPELIEQTKQQIRALVNEIAQLARRSDVAPAEFYSEFLTRVVSALAAIGGVVWTLEDEGRLSLQYQINLQKSGLRENEQGQIQHSRLLSKVLRTGEALLVPPHSGASEDDDEATNPTDFLLVLGPLKTDLEVVGVVEIFQRPESAVSTQRGYLRFVMQMCELAADFIKSHQLRHFSDRQVLWTQLEDFTRRVHATLDPWLTAYTIANEGRRLIECDRVSVAIRRGRKCKIEAVSGQDLFDKRSNTVRLLGELATRVVDTGEAVWYTGDTSNMAPQVEEAVQEYVDESHSKTVAVLPLSRPPLGEEAQDPEDPEKAEEPIGALIVERIEDSRLPETMLHRVDVVAQHSSAALANAMEHQDLFLMPLWRLLGKTKWLFRAKNLPKTTTISIIVLIVIIALIVVPWKFQFKADGTLEPILQRGVYARVDGEVKRIDVRHDQEVKAGQPLIELQNPEISKQLEEVRGKLNTTQSQLRAKRWDKHRNTGNEEDRARLDNEIMVLEENERSFKNQIEILERKVQNMTVTSPIDGKVVTWEIENLLSGRPVQTSQMLLEVADTKGSWQLEIKMPEKRMGEIRHAQEKFGPNLPVTFMLKTEPENSYTGEIQEIRDNVDAGSAEEGSTVLIKVKITDPAFDHEKFSRLLPGAEVSAKVYCGHHSAGYVLLYDLIAWVQSRILFRFF
ncbi:MAG: HlyD family efflux transporter periplasmic adaptor subunit [Pirellulales bacterium]|nr:HlyD family efflux transporter periplasmic adaptor subunit [Pirellulales bacterium]